MEEWMNLIGSYSFIHYVQVDDFKNTAQIAAERWMEMWDFKLSLHLDI
jgi:hypothetical protein